MKTKRSRFSDTCQRITSRYFLHAFPRSFKKAQRIGALFTACAFLLSQVGYGYANPTPLDTSVIDDPAMTPQEMQNQQAAQNQTLQGMQAQAAAMQPRPPVPIGEGIVLQPGEGKQLLLNAHYQAVDQNGDGVLTAEEWIAALRGLRAALGSREGDERYDARYATTPVGSR